MREPLVPEVDKSSIAVSIAPASIDVKEFVCFVLLGLGSWITVNGVYQELPLVSALIYYS
jgi:hypothetical protein